VVVILPQVSEDNAIALGNLRRQGFAVTAIVNAYDNYEFSQSAGPLIAEGIQTLQLRNEDEIPTVCREFVLR
jgi:hypothetical protein